MYIYMSIHLSIYRSLSLSVYPYIYIYIYIYIYTHTHPRSASGGRRAASGARIPGGRGSRGFGFRV